MQSDTQAQANGTSKPWVQFKLNYFERVVLKSLDAKQVRDRDDRPQLMYTLTDGRKMYVDPNVATLLVQNRIQPGEPIVIRKFRGPDGRNLSWELKRTNEGQPIAQFLNGESLDEYGERLANSNPDQLQRALTETISACKAAEIHASKIGYQLRFAPGDIRAMAISKLIGYQRSSLGGGYAA